MKYDDLGTLIYEHVHCDYGDSMAETSRMFILKHVNKTPIDFVYEPFATEKGFRRHPLSEWQEEGISGDQVFPFLMAADIAGNIDQFRNKVGFKITGSEVVSAPGLYFAARKWWPLVNIANLVQELLLKISYRWSDHGKYKDKWWRLVRNVDSYQDYIII